MLTGIIGKKVGMTTLYEAAGKATPCTIVSVEESAVTQLKTVPSDGYCAVQIGFANKKEKHTTRPLQGHFKKAGVAYKRKLVEFRMPAVETLKVGQTVRVDEVFAEGEYVDVAGVSKGKGFQGVVKRHNFSGVGERSHGQHNRERAPGSIGGASFPARVFKGMRMAGRMGGRRVKVFNLRVLKVLSEQNALVVKGSVPGARNSYLILSK